MNRDEVLARSRKDYDQRDEFMVDTLLKAGKSSSELGLILTALVFGIEAFFFNSFNYALLGLYFSIEASKELVKYSKLKEKKSLAYGIICAVIGLLLIVAHFMKLN